MLLSTCTWASTKPGTRTPGSTGPDAGTMDAMRPSRMVTVHGRTIPDTTSATW